MRVAVLIPHRPDHGQRDRLYRYVVDSWRALGESVFVGVHDGPGPWNAAAAFNAAFALAAEAGQHDAVAMFGGDHVPQPAALRRAETLLETHPWLALFSSTGLLGRSHTEMILAGADPRMFGYQDIIGCCEGVLAVRMSVWRDVGGMDERFAGWGAEDSAFRAALSTLHQPTQVLPGTLPHLWHEPAPRGEPTNANIQLFHGQYAPAVGNPEAMRAVLNRR